MTSVTAHVRTRLYFTSESHVQSLVNALRCWSMDEVTHAVLQLYPHRSSLTDVLAVACRRPFAW
jgi:hypothetical protein